MACRPRTTASAGTSSCATTRTTSSSGAIRSTSTAAGRESVDGVLYPRAGALGGCTAHNAMILAYPFNSDWDQLADLTGDASWRADAMRAYFQRLENCRHRGARALQGAVRLEPEPARLVRLADDRAGDAGIGVRDCDLRRTILGSAKRAPGRRWPHRSITPGGRARAIRTTGGSCPRIPSASATRRSRRRAPAGRRARAPAGRRAAVPDRLAIKTNALVTRVLFDGTRAIGVE